MPSRLLCVGLTTLDIVGRPIDAIPSGGRTRLIDGIEVVPAGTAGGTALVAAALGMSTALASAVGNDGAGRFVRRELEARGVDTRLLVTDDTRRTSTTILAIGADGERPNFHAVGASSFMAATNGLKRAAREAGFLHYGGVGGPHLDGGPGAELLADARLGGATIILDLIGPSPRTMAELALLLPSVDYFMPNMEEALFLTGEGTPEGVAAVFARMGARACVFKWGGKGAFVSAEGQSFVAPAHAVNVVDTTSCGDSYCAGFVAALDRGFALREACRFAGATAALVAQGLGTLGKLEDFETTLRYMQEAPLREAM
jgi:sugar/nucleoside kinase (ribokinase family)